MKTNKADTWFSKYIRVRDSFSINNNRYCKCFTCGKILSIKDADCGHFITRDRLNTRYNERNAHAQCTYCNKERHGQQWLHGRNIDNLYGQGTAQHLWNIASIKQKILSPVEIDAIAKTYKTKYENIVGKINGNTCCKTK